MFDTPRVYSITFSEGEGFVVSREGKRLPGTYMDSDSAVAALVKYFPRDVMARNLTNRFKELYRLDHGGKEPPTREEKIEEYKRWVVLTLDESLRRADGGMAYKRYQNALEKLRELSYSMSESDIEEAKKRARG